MISVFLKEDGVLFSGFVEKIICKKENQFLQIEIEGISATERLDRYKKRQSFQNTGMTYRQVIHKVLTGQDQVRFRWNLKEDRAIGVPLIQYDETDWTFLKRLCSHFHESLFSDCRTRHPQKIFVENVDGSVTCSMDDNSGITIGSNTGISFLADGEISCTGRNITIMTPVKAVSRTAQSNIELCRDINLYAPEGVKTIGTGGKAGKHAEASVGKLLREPEMEHWQTSFSAIAAVPQMDLGQIGEAGDVIDIFANGSVPGMAGGSAVVAMSEVMAGKKESETSFPSVFKSMDNYTVKGGYKLPEE